MLRESSINCYLVHSTDGTAFRYYFEDIKDAERLLAENRQNYNIKPVTVEHTMIKVAKNWDEFLENKEEKEKVINKLSFYERFLLDLL